MRFLRSPSQPRMMSGKLTRRATLGSLLGIAALLGACNPATFSGSGFGDPNGAINNSLTAADPTGEVLGSGTVRVALLTPTSGPGAVGQAGQAIRNAAAMALQDYSSADLQLIVKDVGSGTTAASQQASRALAEGAQLIIGPLRSDAVKQAGRVAKPAGVPMIAFSTDTGAAAPGVYLINFSPENDVERILSYASSQGKRSMAAMVPTNAYGNVVEAALRQYASRYGIRVMTIEKYKSGSQPDPFGLQQAAEGVAKVKDQIDMVFIPEAAAAVNSAQLLAGQGVRNKNVTFLGTSQWDQASITAEPMLEGAWYPAPPRSLQNLDGRTIGFQTFATRYSAQFGSQPPRVASLAYDSVILAAALVAQAGERRFSPEILTDPNGFIGFGDGYFRFRADGTSQRSLAIMQISKGSAQIVDNAPMSVAGLPQ
ncbi:penicillin-binding protein activator [uncultured Cohaesibacter sp.]|uniref:penicillin-binding protein activator n=1 Tax=uncultured Cohaesibacter sp. TaxID=1002546 RepID=UPI00292EBC26|nr:penicillin-binding protein activator [uncultured Cohaesibacter sp.]